MYVRLCVVREFFVGENRFPFDRFALCFVGSNARTYELGTYCLLLTIVSYTNDTLSAIYSENVRSVHMGPTRMALGNDTQHTLLFCSQNKDERMNGRTNDDGVNSSSTIEKNN